MANVWRRLLLVACLAALAIQASQAGFENHETYLVKTVEVDKLGEGLVIVRRFMPSSLDQQGRCQRYALVLYNYYKQHQMDQFRLANIGLASNERVWDSFKTITMDTLRDLYMDAIKQLQADSDLDQSFLELVDCLRVKFNNYDARARSFLNNKQLKRVVEQYKSILEQKMEFFLDEHYRHPSIRLEELEEPVRRTLVNWFGGNEKLAYSRFSSSLGSADHLEPPVARVEPTLPPPTLPQVQAPKPNLKPQPVQVPPVIIPSFAPTPAPPQQQQPAAVRATEAPAAQVTLPEPPKPIAAPAAPVEVKPVATETPQVHLEPQLGAESLVERLPEPQLQLLLKVIQLLHDLYNTLPLESKLNDRCQAYSELLTSPPDRLGKQLVEEISKQVGERISKKGPSEEKFVPDSNTRDTFLFTVSAFPKQDIGNETWMDMVDCVSQWELVDGQVRDFMNNPQHYYEALAMPPSQ